MSIVPVLDRSKITFDLPQPQTNPSREGMLSINMLKFDYKFGIKFDPDTHKGFGAPGLSPERCRIWIVQNLVFERLFFQYGDKKLDEN